MIVRVMPYSEKPQKIYHDDSYPRAQDRPLEIVTARVTVTSHRLEFLAGELPGRISATAHGFINLDSHM